MLKRKEASTVMYELLHLMPKFLENLEALVKQKPSLRAKVNRVLDLYMSDCAKLNRTPLHNPKRVIFHTDMDREKRLIDEPLGPAKPSECAILYIDHHKEANRFGEEYNTDTVGAIERGVAKRRSVTAPSEKQLGSEVGESRKAVGRRKQSGTYGEFLKRKELVKLGVQAVVADRVLAQPSAAGLKVLGLSEDLCDKIDVAFYNKLPSSPVLLPIPGPEAPPPLAVTRAQLASVLRMPLHKFLAIMTDEQRQLAQRENRRLYVVRGAAGSGKTIIGIRRIEHLQSQRDLFDTRPILFTCYNRVLRGAVQQMVEATLGGSVSDAGIEVRTIHDVLGALAKEWGLPKVGKRVSEQVLLPIVGQVRESVADAHVLTKWSNEAILSEIREVVFGRAIARRRDYLSADRSGRGVDRRLDARAREVMWAVYETFRVRCRERGITTWEHEAARLAQHIEKHPATAPRYAGIVIDEAQDLMPAAVRVLVGVQAGNTDNMLILGDAAQNVYQSGFRWKHLGLRIAGGQVNTIRRCFRSTSNIVRAASPLITGQAGELEDDLVIPLAGDEQAPEVRHQLFESSEVELDTTAYSIATLLQDGVPASSIGVLIDDSKVRRALAEKLAELDCPTEELYKPGGTKSINVFEQSVKLLTTWSAKGLEFQVLFLPGVTEARFRTREVSPEEVDRARRALYTAMVRCAWELHISAVEGEKSALLSELDLGIPSSPD